MSDPNHLPLFHPARRALHGRSKNVSTLFQEALHGRSKNVSTLFQEIPPTRSEGPEQFTSYNVSVAAFIIDGAILLLGTLALHWNKEK